MGRLFGTDGARGIANSELTCETAMNIGRAAAYVLTEKTTEKPKVLIGKDTRVSSNMLEMALAAGLCSVGADVVLVGFVPTPAIAYLVKDREADAGIMISASHNPCEYNGIKIFDGNGFKLPDALEEEIEALVLDDMSPVEFPTGGDIGSVFARYDYVDLYIDHLVRSVRADLTGMKIAIDCANGCASYTAEKFFKKLGANVHMMHDSPNGVNINEHCGSTHMDELCARVVSEKADIGIAFDGDADRCIAVDENGMEVHGDYILYVCGKYLKECGKLQNNTVVATVMSNMGLFKAMKRENIDICVTTVGDKYVNEAMVANGYVLGGEQSGHIIFSKHATTGDGILTALMLMEVILEKKQSLGTLCRGMQMYPQLLKNVKVEDKAAVTGNARVQAEKERISAALGEDGRILLRESGTEPVIRVMVEAQSDELCAKYVDKMVRVIREEGLAVE